MSNATANAERRAATQLADAILELLRLQQQTIVTQLQRQVPAVSSTQWVKKEVPLKLLVDIQEAALLLDVSDRTVWAMTQPRGPIPVVRMGRSVRYSLEDLKNWIRQNKEQTHGSNPDEDRTSPDQ